MKVILGHAPFSFASWIRVTEILFAIDYRRSRLQAKKVILILCATLSLQPAAGQKPSERAPIRMNYLIKNEMDIGPGYLIKRAKLN